MLLDKEDYREIASPAIHWAFEKDFDGGLGKETLRKSLEEAAFLVRDGAYEVLQEELLTFLNRVDLEDKEPWYLHMLREVVEALMANPTCDEGAKELGTAFRKINRAQARNRGESAALRRIDFSFHVRVISFRFSATASFSMRSRR